MPDTDQNVPTTEVDEVTVDATEESVTETESTTSPSMVGEALDATQNLIIRLTQQLEELQGKQHELKEMMKNIFDNDETLKQAQQIVDEQSKTARSRKNEITQTQEVIDLKTKIADISDDLKMVTESLNTHLLNYYQLTGSKSVDFPGGEEREMVIRVRLKKTSLKND